MKKQFYKAEAYRINRSAYGGYISNYDYDGRTSMCDIAERIASDFRFDERCKANLELKNRQE